MKKEIKKIIVSIMYRLRIGVRVNKSRSTEIKNSGNIFHTSIRTNGKCEINFGKGSRIRNASIKIKGNDNLLVIEEGVRFSGEIELFGDGNYLRIGKNSHINGANLFVHNGTKLEIGTSCLFSTKIDVRTSDSHKIFNSDGIRINEAKDISIGDNVWIGRMVSVVKGSKIGEGSVIGSMSLVAGVIPDKVIAAGVPAKPIRENISWEG